MRSPLRSLLAPGGALLAAVLLLVVLSGAGRGGEAVYKYPITTVSPDASAAPSTTTPPPPTEAIPVDTTAVPQEVAATTIPGDPCVATVGDNESIDMVVARTPGVDRASIDAENGLPIDHVVHPGEQLDVCVGNQIDDVTGAGRVPPPAEDVMAMQNKLNELFANTSMHKLNVDGVPGGLTQQMLCAARMGLGLRVSTGYLIPGSDEANYLFQATGLIIPRGAATHADKWVLIDKTCQVIFTGEADHGIVDVFPTSTGQSGFETTNVEGLPAFRFDPALDTDGWHDSTEFPSPVDSPTSGNMYKPIYFNGGQAFHGANYIPPEPRSKGCARTFPEHQDRIVAWLGLEDLTEPTWKKSLIDVVVSVQGEFRPLPPTATTQVAAEPADPPADPAASGNSGPPASTISPN